MKFVLAPDSFKESMTSKEACNAMERGIKKVIKDAECIKVPMADGGEGTVEALVEATNGSILNIVVKDPLGKDTKAKFGMLGNSKTAIIEMAEASGIALIDREKRNPMITTTYGTGEIIKHALDLGVERIVIGIGGSATNDGGIGMVQALGGKFLDENGKELPFGGGELNRLHKIDISGLDKRLKNIEIEVACDVTNPLCGPKGASHVFGPQKGATEEMVLKLDRNLNHYSKKIKEYLGKDIKDIEGAGAAGGLGAALVAFLDGKLKRGIELVIKHTALEEKLENADFLFTGEGSIDSQTICGKTPMGVALVAKKKGIKTIAFGGRILEGAENLYSIGVTSIFGITPGAISLDKALMDGEKNLERTTENIVRLLKN